MTTGFEVAIQVFGGRIVLRIFGVQESSQTQTFSNKASILCPQGCVLQKIATDLFIWVLESPISHSMCIVKSLLGFQVLNGCTCTDFQGPCTDHFRQKSIIKGCYWRLLRSKRWNKGINAFLWVCRRPQGHGHNYWIWSRNSGLWRPDCTPLLTGS